MTSLSAMPRRAVAFVTMTSLVYLMTSLASVDAANLTLKLSYRLVEDSPPGTAIGNVDVDSGLSAVNPRDRRPNPYRFSFSNATGRLPRAVLSLLVVNDSTGVVSSSKPVDRSTICPYMDTCDAELNVFVRSADFFQMIQLVVSIVGVNRHAPSFGVERVELNLTESAVPGSVWSLPSADDPDGGVDGVQSYDIRPRTAQFGLEVIGLPDGSSYVRLKLLTYLNRQLNDSYSLTLLAFDGGSPQRNGSVSILIRVTGLVDDATRFSNDTYDFTVNENLPVGSVITGVTASSPHGNAVIEYSLDDSAVQQCQQVFSIRSTTGEIVVIGAVDYEKTHECLLTIVAVDRSRPTSLPAHARVQIHIRDLNDNPPELNVNPLTSSGRPEVRDGSPVGAFVAYVFATDPDTGNGSVVNCSVDDGGGGRYFRLELDGVDGTAYQLKTSMVFGRGHLPIYRVSVSCQDHGSPPMKSNVTQLDVIVVDSGPRFPAANLTVTLPAPSQLSPPTVVVVLNATGSDFGPEAEIAYSLRFVAGNTDVLVVDRSTGVVTIRVGLNREDINRTFVYQVTAVDHGTPPLSATATLVLLVVDGGATSPSLSTSGAGIAVRSTVVSNQPEAFPASTSTTPSTSGLSSTSTVLALADAQSKDGRISSDVIIAVVVCGSVVVIMLITGVVVIAICCRRRSVLAKKENNKQFTEASQAGSSSANVDRLTPSTICGMPNFTDDDVIITNGSERSCSPSVVASSSEHDSYSSTSPLTRPLAPPTIVGCHPSSGPVRQDIRPTPVWTQNPRNIDRRVPLPDRTRCVQHGGPTTRPPDCFNHLKEVRLIVDQESDSGFSGSVSSNGQPPCDIASQSSSVYSACRSPVDPRLVATGVYSPTRATELGVRPYQHDLRHGSAAPSRRNNIDRNNSVTKLAPPGERVRSARAPPGERCGNQAPIVLSGSLTAGFDTYV